MGGGGGGEGEGLLTHTIKLATRTLSPRVSKISDLFYALWTYSGEISDKMICQGVVAVIFRTKGHEKLGKWAFLFLFRIDEICRGGGGGVQFGVLFSSEKAELLWRHISKSGTATYLKCRNFHRFMPIISCTKFGFNQTVLTVLSGVLAKKPSP